MTIEKTEIEKSQKHQFEVIYGDEFDEKAFKDRIYLEIIVTKEYKEVEEIEEGATGDAEGTGDTENGEDTGENGEDTGEKGEDTGEAGDSEDTGDTGDSGNSAAGVS